MFLSRGVKSTTVKMQTHALAFLCLAFSLLDNIQESCKKNKNKKTRLVLSLSARMHASCVYKAMTSVKGKLHQRLFLRVFQSNFPRLKVSMFAPLCGFFPLLKLATTFTKRLLSLFFVLQKNRSIQK